MPNLSKNKKTKLRFPTLEQLRSSGEIIYAIIYCRVSSDRQAKEGNGLDSQEQRCRDYAKSNGFVVLDEAIFREAASGGGSYTGRQKQVDILEYIDKHAHLNFVFIIDDISRLARDVQAHFELRVLLTERGVDVASPNFNFEDSPEGELVEGMMAMVSQYHRKGNKRQVIQKQKARLETGYWPFGGKKGYTMVSSDHGKLAVPHETEAAIMATALEGFSTGVFVRKIDACQYLVDNAFWKRGAAVLYISKFDEFLRDPFYCGDIQYKKWAVSRRKGKHQGIISTATFDLIQKRLGAEQLNKRVRRDTREDFPMRGLMICDACGKHLTGGPSKAKGITYGYYFCQNYECPSFRTSIVSSVVDSDFNKLLQKSRLNPKLGDVISNLFDELWNDEIGNLKKEEVIGMQSKSFLEDRIKNLTDLVIGAKSDAVRSIYEKQIEKAAEELANAEGELVSESDLAIPYRNALDKALRLVKSPCEVWTEVDVIEKHRLYFFLFEQKIPYSIKDGYRNDKIPCTVGLFEAFAGANTIDVDMGALKPRVMEVNKQVSMRSTALCLEYDLEAVRSNHCSSFECFGLFMKRGTVPILMHVAAISVSGIRNCDTNLT